MKDAEITAMRELIAKYLKIAIRYMPTMLRNINKTMNMMKGELEDNKKTKTFFLKENHRTFRDVKQSNI